MSIASEITRIAGLRDTIRSKLLDFGIITDSSAKLSACSEAIDNIQESSLSIPSIAITPGMSVDSSTGIVTASGSGSGTVSASKGYSKGTSGAVNASASNTLQLPTQAAQTITPGTSNKTIAAGRWLTGGQTIKGDSNLVSANIKSGTSIFGVSGSLTGVKVITGQSSMYIQSRPTSYDSSTGVAGSAAKNHLCVTIPLSGISTVYGIFAANVGYGTGEFISQGTQKIIGGSWNRTQTSSIAFFKCQFTFWTEGLALKSSVSDYHPGAITYATISDTSLIVPLCRYNTVNGKYQSQKINYWLIGK